jgi:dihydrofolate synthase/folylpolyglutamate synthase
LQQLAARLPVTAENIQQGLQSVTLMGRMQRVHEQPEVLLDVAHNPHAAKELAAWLKKNPRNGKTFAIFSILADKDIAGVVEIMADVLDEWHVVALSSSRALSSQALADKIKASGVKVPVYTYPDFQSAWNSVHLSAEKQARVVAFGSFLVVSGMLEILVPQRG